MNVEELDDRLQQGLASLREVPACSLAAWREAWSNSYGVRTVHTPRGHCIISALKRLSPASS